MTGYICLSNDGNIIVKCPYEYRTVPSSLGGRWRKKSKTWKLAFTVNAVEQLIKQLPDISIHREVAERLTEQLEKEQELEHIASLAKDDKHVQLRVDGVKLALYNYQKLGVLFAVKNAVGVLIADEMGLGKTAQAIATGCYWKYKYGAKRALVVTPASLKWNWPIEIEKFTDEPYVVIDGTPKKRLDLWENEDAFFYVVNFELLMEDLFGGRDVSIKPDDDDATIVRKEKMMAKAEERAAELAPIRERKWDVIIVDEAHFLKTPSAKRTKNVRALNGDFRIALTGTPIDGKLEELHSLMEFVQPGVLESRTRFLQKHATYDFWGKVTGYKRIDEVREKIRPFFIRRLKKDVLTELPDKIYENRIVTLTSAEHKVYRQLAARSHEITEDAEAMVAVIRCKQYCDHPALVDLPVGKGVPSKMQAFLDVIREVVIDNAHKAVVFSQYSSMNEVLKQHLDALGLTYLYIWSETPKKQRADMQQQFNTDPNIDLMVGTDAMSLGLNFTAADYVINYDDNWSPAVMSQREDRCHRIGQKNAVTVVNFICRDTIEERIREVLYSKSVVSSEALGDEMDEMVLRRLGPKEIARLL